MSLPGEGQQISFEDLNNEIGAEPNAQIDLDSTAELFSLTRPHGMDEFWGQSLIGLSIDPTIYEFLSTGGNVTFSVTNNRDGTTVTATETADWFSISNLSNTGFTVTADPREVGNDNGRNSTITVSNGTDTLDPIPISQTANPATIGLSSNSVSVDGDGTGENISITSNTTWEFSSIASWVDLEVSSGDGNYTNLLVGAKTAQNPGAPERSDVITLSTTTTRDDKSTNLTVTQVEGDPITISITPDNVSVGGLVGNFNFQVSTNVATYQVTAVPDFVSSYTINEFGVSVVIDDNNASGASTREGTLTVETVTGYTEVSADAIITQSAVVPESIQVYPFDSISDISSAGEANKIFVVDVADSYQTLWEPKKVAFPMDPSGTDWATINTVGTSGDGTIEVTFSANPAGGSIRRIGIGAYKVGDTNLQSTTYLTQDPQESVSFSADRSMSNMLAWDNLDFGGTITTSASTVNWTLTSNRSWLKLSKDNSTFSTSINGTNNDTIYLRLSANTGGARAGSITLSSTNAETSTSSFAFSQVVGWVKGTEYAYGNTECEAEENGGGVNPI